ncbi:MAG: trypsin-like peptidase domain-containing protein [Clostridiaceae bacterium]
MDNKDEYKNDETSDNSSSINKNDETNESINEQVNSTGSTDQSDLKDEVNQNEDTQVHEEVSEMASNSDAKSNEPEIRQEPERYVYRGGSAYVGEEHAYKSKRGFSKLAMIAVALICTLLGTSLGVYSTLNILPGTSMFNESKLGQMLEEGSKVNTVQISTPQLSSEGLTIPEIVKMVQPAVVTVTVQVPAPASFFNPQAGYSESIGTGFILNDEGLIATNYHVVEGGETIKVTLYTGKEVAAKVVNYDATNDLAVLSLTEDVAIPGKVTLGDSDNLQVGESVIAIGNPLSQEFAGSVTSGIVSATDRAVVVNNAEYHYIQTDAAINGGNSGGPLINARGEVIGINSAKISSSASASIEGIGFAIPINVLTSKIDVLSKAQLLVGIAGRDINDATGEQSSLPVGILVVEVAENSPASLASLKVGDVITEFDGKVVKSVQELNDLKNTKSAGDTVSLKVYREGTYLDLQLTLVVKP